MPTICRHAAAIVMAAALGFAGRSAHADSRVVSLPQSSSYGFSAGNWATMGTSTSTSSSALPASAPNASGFNIIINPNTTLSSNTAALAAFNRAADQWKAFINDPITINIDAGLDALGVNTIGETSSFALMADYTTIRDQVVADADSDDGILAGTPTAAQFVAYVPDGKTLTGNLAASKASLKALQFEDLDADFGASDGTITFSTNFAFDFDNSDGVTPGTMDFETVAAHEIGHLLGFSSSVDEYDAGATAINLQTLDLFRFMNAIGNKPTSAFDFATTPRSLVPGADEIFSDVTSEFRMSTGFLLGDGNQASHWKADDLTGIYIGLLDPTLAYGQVSNITYADLRALDLIGYDITLPEPTMMTLVIPLSALLTRRRSRFNSA